MVCLVITNRAVNLSSFANSARAILRLLVVVGACNAGAQHQLRGVVLENDRYNQLPLSQTYGHQVTLPPRASLTHHLPRVVTQSTTNTASTWAIAWYGYGALDARVRNLEGDSVTMRCTLAPAFVYHEVQKSPGCSEPVSLIDALEFLKVRGSPAFADFREFCAAPGATLDDSVPIKRLDGYARIFNSYDPANVKIHSIKKAISTGSPVVAGIIAPPSLQFALEFWQPREKEPLTEYGGHALVITAYDDNLFGGGAFHVVNSWGKGWGKNGMTWVRYNDMAAYILYGFQLLKSAPRLKGEIKFFSDAGQPMNARGDNGTYELVTSYRTGDKFRVQLDTKSPVFLRAFVLDPSGQTSQIFPDKGQHTLTSGALMLPDEVGAYTLTEPPGKNVFVFAIATSEWALIDVDPALGSTKNFPATDPRWDKDRISFDSSGPLIVVRLTLRQL